MLQKYGKDITLCPKCNSRKLMLIHIDYGGYETKPVKVRLTITDTNGKPMHHRNKKQGLSGNEKVLFKGK